MLFSLGWPEARVNAASLILATGTSSQKNKLFSEIAPQFRATWHSL